MRDNGATFQPISKKASKTSCTSSSSEDMKAQECWTYAGQFRQRNQPMEARLIRTQRTAKAARESGMQLCPYGKLASLGVEISRLGDKGLRGILRRLLRKNCPQGDKAGNSGEQSPEDFAIPSSPQNGRGNFYWWNLERCIFQPWCKDCWACEYAVVLHSLLLFPGGDSPNSRGDKTPLSWMAEVRTLSASSPKSGPK